MHLKIILQIILFCATCSLCGIVVSVLLHETVLDFR